MSETQTVAPPAEAAPATEAPAVAVEAKPESLTIETSILGDAKPADAERPAEEKPADEAAAAPAEYKDLKLPEGVKADDPALAAFSAEALKLGITQPAAEALLAQVAPKIAEMAAAPYKLWRDTQVAWQAEIKADKEFGGDKLAPTTQSIGRLLDNPQFCDPALRDALISTGAGNNPAVYRTFARLAAVLTEGSHVSGQPPAPTRKPLAELMYPSMTQES